MVEATTSRPLTPQSSVTPENSALGMMASTSSYVLLLCLPSCVWAGMASI